MYECRHWCLIIVLHQLNKTQLFVNVVLDSFVSMIDINELSDCRYSFLEYGIIRAKAIAVVICHSVNYLHSATVFCHHILLFHICTRKNIFYYILKNGVKSICVYS